MRSRARQSSSRVSFASQHGPPEQMPFDNVVGKHFDSGDHPECLRRAVEAIRLPQVRARQRAARPTAG
jgi:hypothetical protein